MRKRLLIPAIAMLALLAAAIPVFAQDAAEDAPSPSASVELRVWQSVRSPIDFWVSATIGGGGGGEWRTSRVDMVVPLGGGWRTGDLTVEGLALAIDLRLHQHPTQTGQVWLSARPAGGSWDEYGTKRLRLDETSRSGRYRYADLPVALEWPDAEPAEPGTPRVALCIPEGLERERLFTRIWRSVATPHRYWISARADDDEARWSTRAVTLAAVGEDDSEDAGEDDAEDEENGWNAGSLTFEAGEADFELRLWEGDGGEDDGALHLSARVAGTTWDEYGTRALTLNRTSASGRFTYANRVVRLTLPEAEPPAPGRAVRDWDCPDTGTGDGTGEATPTPTPGTTNRAPRALAGPPQTVAIGATVTLDGSGSGDIDDGDTLTYSWAKTGGTYTGTVALTGANTVSPSFTVDAALGGLTVIFTLTVTDGGGLTDTDTVTITVLRQQGGSPPPTTPTNQLPTVDAGVDQSGGPRDALNLSASADDPDGDNDAITYLWTIAGGPASILGSVNTAATTVTIPADAAKGRTYTLTVTVTDEDGGTASDSLTVTVNNTAPVADAGDPYKSGRGISATLNGSASSDPDGDSIASYRWQHTGGSYTGPTLTLTPQVGGPEHTRQFIMPTAMDVGDTVIWTLTVTDSNGAYSTDTVRIGASNVAPVANAGADRKVTAGKAVSITLDGSRSGDPDGDDSRIGYSWTVAGTPAATLSNANTATPTLAAPATTTSTTSYTVTLTATDEDGGTHSDTMTVTANNSAPTADPYPGQTPPSTSLVQASRNATITLDATDSSDPDGQTLSYSWARMDDYQNKNGEYGGTVTLMNANTATASFISPTGPNPVSAGRTLTFILTVSDDHGGESSTEFVLTLKANVKPTVDVGADETVSRSSTTPRITIPESTTANPNPKDPDSADNSSFTYKWDACEPYGNDCYPPSTDIFVDDTQRNPELQSLQYLYTGLVLRFTLTVTDVDGGTGSDSMNVTFTN